MYLCYFDESGDPGYVNSPTKVFSLSCVIVQDTAWLFSLDDIVRFRRFLRDKFSLPMRAELKSSFLIHNTGPFEHLGLGDDIRKKIFKMALKLIPKLNKGQGIDVFSIIVDKDEMIKQGREDENPQEEAWERAIERLERYTYYNTDTCVIYPDEGEFHTIRKLLRSKRRFGHVPAHYGTSSLLRPANMILEDPSMRKSSSSYFIQLADLVAYSAYRAYLPIPEFGCSYWELLGDTRIKNVTRIVGGKLRGIKIWPPKEKAP